MVLEILSPFGLEQVKFCRDLASIFKFHFPIFAFEYYRMASNSNNSSCPIIEFCGEDYEYWSIKMKILPLEKAFGIL